MPATDAPLAQVRVLVTRPAAQAEGLAAAVRRAGGEPVMFPTLEIAPLRPSAAQVEQAAWCETLIFVSANAVAHGYPVVQGLAGIGKRIMAVGNATQGALETAGCRHVYSPGEISSSEELAKAPALRNIEDQRICIVRGRGGREALKEILASRGARVSYLECYRRCLPSHWDPRTLERALDIDRGTLVLSVTSTTGLTNLLKMVPGKYRQSLLSRPLAVIGRRQAAAALQSGWLGPVLESAANDEQIVAAIIRWRGRCR